MKNGKMICLPAELKTRKGHTPLLCKKHNKPMKEKNFKLISSYIAYKINISNMKLAANFRRLTTKATATI